MTTPNLAAGLAAERIKYSGHLGRIASQNGRPLRVMPLTRKYEVAHLRSSSDIADFTRSAPALPAFEDAFAAIGRGAIIQTNDGPRAVEDLIPGDTVITASHGPQTLLWHGSTRIIPGAQNERPHMGTMTRLTADALGFGRPSPDLVLGPAARMKHTSPAVKTLTGAAAALLPVRDFIDQSQIIELTPATAVRCYQLGFANHCLINVNGIEIESLHPGTPHTLGLNPEMLSLLLDLFPHITSRHDVGPLVLPRITLRDIDHFDAA